MARQSRERSRERREFMTKHWEVLQDAYLCSMPATSIARKRQTTTQAVRKILRDGWAIGLTYSDVLHYMERW